MCFRLAYQKTEIIRMRPQNPKPRVTADVNLRGTINNKLKNVLFINETQDLKFFIIPWLRQKTSQQLLPLHAILYSLEVFMSKYAVSHSVFISSVTT